MKTISISKSVAAAVKAFALREGKFQIFAGKNPVRLAGGPPQCKAAIARAQQGRFPPSLRDTFTTSEQNSGMGAEFAQKITMRCP